MTKKVPSKISYKHWEGTVTIEKKHSDLDICEFYQMCRSLALAVGYTESTVNEYFDRA
tara:strand:- start:278 stop:451 length:174 start_codon:yes stop_codon:yes gene_type:complete